MIIRYDVLITFSSIHHVLHAEKLLKASNKQFTMLPTPREITLSCGMSIAVMLPDLQEILQNFANHTIDQNGVYQRVDQIYVKIQE